MENQSPPLPYGVNVVSKDCSLAAASVETSADARPRSTQKPGNALLKALSTNVLAQFLPSSFVDRFVNADILTDAEREECVRAVQCQFANNETLKTFLSSQVDCAHRLLVAKDEAKANECKDAGTRVLVHVFLHTRTLPKCAAGTPHMSGLASFIL